METMDMVIDILELPAKGRTPTSPTFSGIISGGVPLCGNTQEVRANLMSRYGVDFSTGGD